MTQTSGVLRVATTQAKPRGSRGTGVGFIRYGVRSCRKDSPRDCWLIGSAWQSSSCSQIRRRGRRADEANRLSLTCRDDTGTDRGESEAQAAAVSVTAYGLAGKSAPAAYRSFGYPCPTWSCSLKRRQGIGRMTLTSGVLRVVTTHARPRIIRSTGNGRIRYCTWSCRKVCSILLPVFRLPVPGLVLRSEEKAGRWANDADRLGFTCRADTRQTEGINSAGENLIRYVRQPRRKDSPQCLPADWFRMTVPLLRSERRAGPACERRLPVGFYVSCRHSPDRGESVAQVRTLSAT